MNKDEALRLALEALESGVKTQFGRLDWIEYDIELVEQAITAIKAALETKDEPVAWRFKTGTFWNREVHWRYVLSLEGTEGLKGLEPLYTAPPQRTWVGLTPACPKGLTEYECEVEGVDLVCFLEYTPDEEGSRDSYGLLNEPGTSENLELVNAYVKGTDVDIGHLLLQYLVDHITTTALEDFKNDDL